MMRVAHLTDIHWQCRPPLSSLWGKRLLGSANLYLAGRRHHFDEAVQTRLVEHVVEQDPDLVIITGDLTAQALPAEFEKARDALDPILQRFPTFIIPGNHDAYTHQAVRERRIWKHFGTWMGPPDAVIPSHGTGDVRVLGLDPNRPTLADAIGRLPDAQLNALTQTLDDVPQDVFCILAIHYPLLGPNGEIYRRRDHTMENIDQVIEAIQAAQRPPDLILHGHRHHGYHGCLKTPVAEIPVYNPGSSGYAFLPEKRRAAGMNIYDIECNALHAVHRFLYDGQAFAPEPGGAYATGR